MTLKDLSIIIPTLNEEEYLPALLESIFNQEYNYNFEVIIVDGHSDDKSLSNIGKYTDLYKNIKIIHSKKRSVTYQRNLGVENATYEHILFLDADVTFPKKFLNDFSNKFGNIPEKCLILVAHIPPRFNILDYIWLSFIFAFILLVKKIKPICSGSFMLTSKAIHEMTGGFDEKIIVGSDVEYGLRAMKLGTSYKFFFQPYVYSDPRRLRKEGRIGLLLKWFRGYMFMVKKGPIYEENRMFDYEFGNYKK